MILPLEIIQEIILYTNFHKTVELFPKIAHYIYTPIEYEPIHKIKKEDIFDWKYEYIPEKYTWNWCSINGYLSILKWLHQNNIKGCTKYTMDFAAENGHLKIVKWLHLNREEGCTTSAMDYAVSNGHIEIVKWLHHNRTEGCTTDAMDQAKSKGHLEIVKYLKENYLVK